MASATHTTDATVHPGSTSILIYEARTRDEAGDEANAIHALEPNRVLSVGGLHFEALPGGVHDELLMLSPPGAEVRVNALPTARLSVLRVGDVVRDADGDLLHVSAFETCEPVVPAGTLLERSCVTCRAPLTSETRVRVCGCGEPRHDEGEDVPADERRDCWLLGACPSCGATPRSEPGFAYWPEDIPRPSKET